MAMNKLPNRKQTKDGAVNVKASTFLMDIYYNNLLARIDCSDLLIATTFSCNLLKKHENLMRLYQFLTTKKISNRSSAINGFLRYDKIN